VQNHPGVSLFGKLHIVCFGALPGGPFFTCGRFCLFFSPGIGWGLLFCRGFAPVNACRFYCGPMFCLKAIAWFAVALY
jgi:hypothetical protein